jgi:hypothetical protein
MHHQQCYLHKAIYSVLRQSYCHWYKSMSGHYTDRSNALLSWLDVHYLVLPGWSIRFSVAELLLRHSRAGLCSAVLTVTGVLLMMMLMIGVLCCVPINRSSWSSPKRWPPEVKTYQWGPFLAQTCTRTHAPTHARAHTHTHSMSVCILAFADQNHISVGISSDTWHIISMCEHTLLDLSQRNISRWCWNAKKDRESKNRFSKQERAPDINSQGIKDLKIRQQGSEWTLCPFIDDMLDCSSTVHNSG